MPDPGPFGETFLEASALAIVAASWVKRPSGGNVETVLPPATQRWLPPDFDLLLPRGRDFLPLVQ